MKFHAFAGAWLLGAMLLALPTPVLAQAHAAVLSDSDAAAVRRVETYLDGVRTLKARFLQIAPDGKTSAGTVWLDRPGKMRFEYDPPSPLLLVAGHGLVVFHDAQLGQTTNIPLGQTPLGLLLREKITLSGDVAITDFQQPAGQIQLTLVRNSAPGDGSLSLYLDASPMALVGWSVIDAQGRETRLRLSNQVAGGTFDQNLFTFIDPDFGKTNENR